MVINTLQYDAQYTQRHINTLQYDARYTQRHINTLQYGARYTQRHINTLQYDALYTQRHINIMLFNVKWYRCKKIALIVLIFLQRPRALENKLLAQRNIDTPIT